MNEPNKIRLIALALIRDGNRIFLSEGYDPHKQQTFYRALGGGVEFGELSQDGLKREFLEEIQAEITNLQYLGCIENLFVFNGLPGHEIIQLYECDFVDPKFYQMDEIEFVDYNRKHRALWVEIDQLKSQELRLVPEVFFEYL